ncbi:hypothetical protein HY798_04035 [Candidatus Falkowbacteria bacterium]|nr:hypothetical protein [Candidatus Falkowbacteria bacterium]
MAVFNNRKNCSLCLTNFARFLFVALIIFELLNVLKILKLNTQFTWVGLFLTSIFCFIFVEMVAYKYRKEKGHNLHWSIWFLVAFGLSLDAAGDFFHLYGQLSWWDQFAHFFVSGVVNFTAFVVISAFFVEGFRYNLLMKTGRFNLALLISSTSAISLGALYEIEEYAEDLIFHTNRLGPRTDTANDLLFNFLGVVASIIIIKIIYHLTKKEEVFE